VFGNFLDRQIGVQTSATETIATKHQSNEYIEVAECMARYIIGCLQICLIPSVVQEDAIAHIKKAFIV